MWYTGMCWVCSNPIKEGFEWLMVRYLWHEKEWIPYKGNAIHDQYMLSFIKDNQECKKWSTNLTTKKFVILVTATLWEHTHIARASDILN